ncbi:MULTISPECIES: hypothetical protein [unclassified Streptomyces]|uniref:hypothetical protein n=1 Tax=unclassified Streptomyces TaxID=2593676 RepID=UPI00331B10B7
MSGAGGAADVVLRRRIAVARDRTDGRARPVGKYAAEPTHPNRAAERGLVDPAAAREVLIRGLGAPRTRQVDRPSRTRGSPPR